MAKRLPSTPPILAGLSYVRPLGSGGFADVFLYEQDMPKRGVAVKVLPSDVQDAELLRMFNSEADVMARLSAHPSIVTVYQAGISADGRPYIVMEYCPDSLAQRYRIERIPVADVLTIGVKMASAIESAHRAGLVHRDIKPSNILITSFGVPVLADFGISSSLLRVAGEELTAMSVPWSAPEVIDESTTGTVASEVWGLGATIYSLLAGHSPFERMERGQNSREHLRRRIARATYTPTGRPDAPESLEIALARAMNRDPRQRFVSALEFAEALRAVQSEQGLTVTPVEVAVNEGSSESWGPAKTTVDFTDASVRGPARSSVEHTSARKRSDPAGLSGRARAEDTGIAAPRPRSRRTWIWVAAAVVVVAALSVGGAFLLGGVI